MKETVNKRILLIAIVVLVVALGAIFVIKSFALRGGSWF